MRVAVLAAALVGAWFTGARADVPAVFDVGVATVNIDPVAPQYLGGFGQGDPTNVVHDSMEVRAMAIRRGAAMVLVAIVDTQGYFAGYQEGPYGVTDARAEVARTLAAEGLAVTPANVIVSSTHSHAAPTIMGIWGPTDAEYLQKVYHGTVDALVAAAHSLRPAHLYVAEADVEAVNGSAVNETDVYQGWRADGKLPLVWARDPVTDATIGVYANVPVHADIVIGIDEGMISADHVGVERDRLGALLGGTALVAMGTLGRQESFVQASGFAEAERVGKHITNEMLRGLVGARPITDPTLSAAEQYIAVPVMNPLLAVLNVGNVVAPGSCNDLSCTIDRSILPPYAAGAIVGTWVNALRIGDVVVAAEPGEAFPEVSASIRKVFNGPRVHIVGMAQDQLGYFYPAETYPWTWFNSSDHQIYNVSLALADEVVEAHAVNAALLGFTPMPAHDTSQFEDVDQARHAGIQFIPIPREQALSGGSALFEFEAARTGAAFRDAPSALTLGTLDGDSFGGEIRWDFGDGATGAGTGKYRTHTYSAAGTYTVTASITDPEDGKEVTWTQQAIVDPPLAALVTVVGDELTAGASGGQGTILAAHWTFSDASTAEGLRVTRPAGASGAVVIVDAAGNIASTTF
jgi:hypothetical protein